ncbi:protein LONGIFOLIA 1 [Phoenix dactylifera]|uniref:Protein LONGIFOLIA 1 n=1 Tax=Phoenix dactylifera TaxID=42345 RepID=A0A8B7MTC0_PHODC|nr:protein LONGIFOLIA 1 [Phoenix dactylifera]XP_038971705.1 protein LONGIFOLIA 1 [Phoenix dactylifera]XP_038971706.1 protein LONGIFOLIA 1 [Phoenix dactylifera]XP_038971707.1 protein LONGIFOLIA 1 [Phoenix dactylifera]
MPAKFLHTFADENTEAQKQIGCVDGVFQMLDRYHIFKGRRLNGHNHKRFPSGHALSNSSSVGADCGACTPQIVLEKNHSKSSNENQGVSMESSGTSFSSSSCSSFSSLECNGSTRQKPSSMDRTFLERSIRNSVGLKNSNVTSRAIYYESLSDPSYASVQSGRQSLDFRDVVKDSIHRETRSLSIKTSTKEEVKNRMLKHRDSPRLMQLSKSADRSYVIGVDGKSRLPDDLSESLRVLVKLKEAPWYCSEASEQPRSSCEEKDTYFFPVSREAPRLSYDGREISCPSLDSPDVSRPVSRLKELPRLSLDSREGSLRSSNFDLKPNSILKDSDSSSINQGVSTPSNFQQEWGSHKCPTSVVAKLMGLEPMPHMGLASQKPVNLTETYTSKTNDPFNGQRNRNPIAKASQATQDSRKDHLLHSPKSSLKDSVPRLKKSDPVNNSRLSIETAPWTQQETIHIPQKTKLGSQEAHLKQQPESVYSEIEKRLKELEFHKSNKDLRDLKQIFDAMQAKGLLETKKGEDQHSKVSVSKNYSGQFPARNDHNFKSTCNLHSTQPFPTLMEGSNTPRAYNSPIVIMKPAKSVIGSGVSASSAIPLEGLSGLQKLQTSHSMYRKMTSTNNRRVKDQTPKASPREPTYQPLLSMDKKSTKKTEEISMQKTRVQIEQLSSRHQHSPRENNGSSVKTSGSLSPRIQERKNETEKRSCPPFPSSESNKSQRSSANRQSLESVSPRGRLRQKPAQAQQKDDQLNDTSSGKRSLSHPGDERSLWSESNISLASQVDIEVTSADRSAEMNLSCLQQGSRSPSRRNAISTSSVIKQKKSSHSLNEDVAAMEVATVAPEHPSPVSVLDASFYQDGMPPSAVSKTPNAFKEHRQNPTALPDNSSPKLSSKVNHKKLENINLVQKLRQLSSTDDEAPATDHRASLCEHRSPDQRFVSEILLASGLLMKDISWGPAGPMPNQLHPSGHPINPDLFLVLEQTKSGSFTKLESVHENSLRPKPGPEKLHRKLLFDVVNELLIQKLELTSPGSHPYLMLQARKLAARFHGGQDLLRELCSKIEQLKAESSISDRCNNDSNLISGEDVLRQSEGWNEFSAEVPNVVLEIERSIFKDLIDEVVSGEGASSLQTGKQAAEATIC